MKPILIAARGLLLAWLFAGRQLSLLLDRIGAARVASLPVTPITYDGGFVTMGGRILSDLKLDKDSFRPVADPGDEVALTRHPGSAMAL